MEDGLLFYFSYSWKLEARANEYFAGGASGVPAASRWEAPDVCPSCQKGPVSQVQAVANLAPLLKSPLPTFPLGGFSIHREFSPESVMSLGVEKSEDFPVLCPSAFSRWNSSVGENFSSFLLVP